AFPPDGQREDRTRVRGDPAAVPGRDLRRPRRRVPGPAPGRQPGGAERAARRVAAHGLPRPAALRDRPGAGRPAGGRRRAGAAGPRAAEGGVLLERDPAGPQDGHRLRRGERVLRRPVPDGPEGGVRVRPVRHDGADRLLAGPEGRQGGPAGHRPARPPQGPARRGRPGARGADRHRLPPARRRRRRRRPGRGTPAVRPGRQRAGRGSRRQRAGRGGTAVNAETISSGRLACLLRDAAAGMLPDMAAADLIIRHGHFLHEPAFRRIIAAGASVTDGPPSASAAHKEAVARLRWLISARGLGVLTGEVGTGKTAALRAAADGLDASRHTLIYLPNPQVGVRGIHGALATALGKAPCFYTADLIPQVEAALAAEADERNRNVILAIDESHMLTRDQLEAVRMITNPNLDSAS